jgi:hypothetical protein
VDYGFLEEWNLIPPLLRGLEKDFDISELTMICEHPFSRAKSTVIKNSYETGFIEEL